jgi:hypothetical protein
MKKFNLGISTEAPYRTDTKRGTRFSGESVVNPKTLSVFDSRDNKVDLQKLMIGVWRFPLRYSVHVSVVMMNPGGTLKPLLK